MKKLHLVCNAHLDPVWLWPWAEGAAEAVSTFRTAADFCEKYDRFVFCHNEALLYQWVEEYEPELFARIQKLVKKGNWKIMGGWYLQPDCNHLSGESFIRQIQEGRTYFAEKFGVRPETAVNFDSFGHSRGLVQILAKTGYKNYLFMRGFHNGEIFLWKGYDGSEVSAHCIWGGYATLKGEAAQSIQKVMDYYKENTPYDVCMRAWGIGDHGGGASVPDVEGVEKLIAESTDIEILQSDPDAFFRDVDKKNLAAHSDALCHCMVGCYTSMVRVKRLHRKLENKIDVCKTMMTHAGIWDDAINEAEKDLMFSQFHDILPGSMVQSGEEQELGRLQHGILIADKLIMRAFIKLCAGQKKAADGEIPVLIYNPHPYPVRGNFAFEFSLSSQNWNEGEYTYAKVYDKKGKELPAQNEKPECSVNLDWRKRVVFTAELTPCSMNRFDAKLFVGDAANRIEKADQTDPHILIKTKFGAVKINKQTGLLTKLDTRGTVQLENVGRIYVIQDNEDPWGMTVDRFNNKIGEMTLMNKGEANAFCGYPEAETGNVRVVENGAAACKVQAFFKAEKSFAMVTYTIPKEIDYIDVQVTMLANDVNRMYKFVVGADGESDFLGQTAFGVRKLEQDGKEIAFHQWCAKGNIYIANNGSYAGSYENGEILLSLLRTPVYAAHPIYDRPICENNRYSDHIDLGQREISFRIFCGENLPIDRLAQCYNAAPEVLSFFPQGTGKKADPLCVINNENIIMTYVSPVPTGYIIRFYNGTENGQKSCVQFLDWQEELTFAPYEAKTLRYENGKMTECNMLGEAL